MGIGGITKDGLVLCSNGDVEEHDPESILQAIANMPQKSFYQRHCLEQCQNNCDNCKLMACPIADQ